MGGWGRRGITTGEGILGRKNVLWSRDGIDWIFLVVGIFYDLAEISNTKLIQKIDQISYRYTDYT